MFCEKCGAQLIDGASFCTKCGSPVSGGANSHRLRRKLGTGALIGIIAGGIAVVAIVLVLCGVFGGAKGYRSQTELIDDYFDAVEDRDYRKLVHMLAPGLTEYAYGELGTSSDRSLIEELDDWYYDYYGFEVDDWYIEEVDYYDHSDIQNLHQHGIKADEYVDVWVVAHFENGEEYDIDFDLVKVNGKWYIIEVW